MPEGVRNPWDEKYSGETYYYGVSPNDFLKEFASRIPNGGRVLCLAEGEGRNAVYLAGIGFQVTAVDASRVGLDKLLRLAKERGVGVEAIQADLSEFEIEPEKWDAVVSIWCHTPPELRKRLHENSVKGLKREGVFILEAYRPKQLEYNTGGPSTIDLLMNLEELKSDLAGLRLEFGREIDREIQEGKRHSGMSAVVQIVGIKT